MAAKVVEVYTDKADELQVNQVLSEHYETREASYRNIKVFKES